MSTAKFKDTMIGSADIMKSAQFYKDFLGMEVSQEGDGSFVILKDKETNQSLCIISDASMKNAVPGIDSQNIDQTLSALEANGGKIVRRWEVTKMKGANVQDPDGRDLMVWQSI